MGFERLRNWKSCLHYSGVPDLIARAQKRGWWGWVLQVLLLSCSGTQVSKRAVLCSVQQAWGLIRSGKIPAVRAGERSFSGVLAHIPSHRVVRGGRAQLRVLEEHHAPLGV